MTKDGESLVQTSKPTKEVMSKTILDHVALAVFDIEKKVEFYKKIGIIFEDKREEVQSQGVLTAFAEIAPGSHIELLQPLGQSGTVYEFLQKKGEGIHHLCFKTKNIREKCIELEREGIKLIYPAPVKGARDCLVNFIHPKSTGGILIELVES